MPRYVSFYDESLGRQIEGSYITDGKVIHAGSGTLGAKSARFGHFGRSRFDQMGQDLIAQDLLSELAHREAQNSHGHGH
ncbi:MAG TPA: hypothetical protein VFU86_04890 [Terriglobales bacterium]|nr:hypothetical protein [Terriglobales bacterium]